MKYKSIQYTLHVGDIDIKSIAVYVCKYSMQNTEKSVSTMYIM